MHSTFKSSALAFLLAACGAADASSLPEGDSPPPLPGPQASPEPPSSSTTSPGNGGAPGTPAPSTPAKPGASGHPFFVAVGYGGRRVTSGDSGKTWPNDVQDAPNGNDDPRLLRGVHCATGICVACGGGAGGGRFVVTRDGKTWESHPTGTGGIGDLTYGDGLWVAPGFRSRDGVTWERREMPPGDHMRKIAFGGGSFVAVGDTGRRIRTKDGVSWSNETTGGRDLSGIAWGNGRFVAIGFGGRRVISTDGAKWTNDVSDPALGDFGGIVFANGRFVAGSPVALVSSPDGVTWTRHSGDHPAGPIAYGAGKYVGISWKNVRLISSDGLAWRAAGDDGESGNALASIAFGELAPP